MRSLANTGEYRNARVPVARRRGPFGTLHLAPRCLAFVPRAARVVFARNYKSTMSGASSFYVCDAVARERNWTIEEFIFRNNEGSTQLEMIFVMLTRFFDRLTIRSDTVTLGCFLFTLHIISAIPRRRGRRERANEPASRDNVFKISNLTLVVRFNVRRAFFLCFFSCSRVPPTLLFHTKNGLARSYWFLIWLANTSFFTSRKYLLFRL